MKLLHDYYIITVDKRYENEKTRAGLTTLNEAILVDSNPEGEQNDDAHLRHKRIYGTVVTCPRNFTSTIVNLVDEGCPGHHVFVGHDFIQTFHNTGRDKKYIPRYYPSTYDGYQTITLRDFGRMTDVKEQDRVYFSYLVTEPENHLGSFKGKLMYKMRVDDIHCVVRPIMGFRKKGKPYKIGSEILMQGGWVLVQPRWETQEEITTKSGILMKPRPERIATETHKYLDGVVKHVRSKSDIRPQDHIYFEYHADYVMRVEGQDYYCMREDEILCKIN